MWKSQENMKVSSGGTSIKLGGGGSKKKIGKRKFYGKKWKNASEAGKNLLLFANFTLKSSNLVLF